MFRVGFKRRYGGYYNPCMALSTVCLGNCLIIRVLYRDIDVGSERGYIGTYRVQGLHYASGCMSTCFLFGDARVLCICTGAHTDFYLGFFQMKGLLACPCVPGFRV